jgi:hypothetical protein
LLTAMAGPYLVYQTGKLLLLPVPQVSFRVDKGSGKSEWPRMRAESLDLNEPVIARASTPSTVWN